MHAMCSGGDGDIRACIDEYACISGFRGLNSARHELEDVARIEVLFSNLDVFDAVVYRAANVFQDLFIAARDVIAPHL